MDNYEYIIASLPDIEPDKGPSQETATQIIDFVRDQLSEKDLAVADILTDSWDDEKLTEELYTKALASSNRFIKEFFGFDLQVRNAKVHSLNMALGRPIDKDIFMPIEEPEPELEATLDKVYSNPDILVKERAIDKLYWQKIEDLTIFDYFDLDAVLGFLAKLHIVQRWLVLDESTGRALFRKLTEDVQSTFKGVNYTEK